MRNISLSVKFFCMILVLVISFSLTACGTSQNSSTTDEAAKTILASSDYSSKLFDTSYVHTVDINISDEDWEDLKANPTAKTKYRTDITIDGETVKDVSFSTKGNTSLTAVAQDKDSDRYSFKINFGKYVDSQTYYGLNKLNLNNIYADATYMKDYLSYEIFRQAGVDSPLVSYVWLTVNGEDHGLYIAIEDISESYLDRTQNGEGELYKPETEQFENMAKGGQPKDNNNDSQQIPQGGMEPPQNGQNSSDFQNNNRPPQMSNDNNGSDRPELPSGDMMPPNGFDMNNVPNGEMPSMPQSGEMPTMPEGAAPPNLPQGGGFGSNAKGADLKYTDDEIDSYSDIFDNDETDADESSNKRVIAALKALSQGENIEEYIDTDEVIRYFAAHNFVLNYDSYTGNMLHNYYLYEKDGRLSMLPWDYNLAFGAFGGGQGGKPDKSGTASSEATALINTGIDTPLSGSQDSARPMWNFIISDEKYLKQYHEVYEELLDYFESGKCDAEIERICNMILPYVEKDSSAFYTSEQLKNAEKTLKSFCRLRAESIRKQLDGKLSAKTSEQNDTDQIDASSITISDMGTNGMGKNNNGFESQKITPPDISEKTTQGSEATTG